MASNKRGKHTAAGRRLIAAMKEVVAHSRGEITLPTRQIDVPERIDVKHIREKSRLSQSAFAARYGFSIRTLQQWEQGRAQPDGPARVLLTIIDRAPKAVESALRRKAS